MKSPEQEQSSEKSSGGFGSSIRETLVGAVDYFQARLQLLQFEAKEAGSDLVGRLICFVVAAVFLGITYLALLTGAIAWIADCSGWRWYFVSLGAALLHLLVAVILIAIARRRFSHPPFRDSIAELDRDREWLEEFRRD